MKRFRKILAVLCLIPGILLTIYGATMAFREKLPDEIVFVDDCCVHEENEGKCVAMTGCLRYDTQVTDSDFGITFDSPAVHRTVSMYQYYEDGYGNMQTGWSSRANGQVKIGNVWYHNGTLPEGLNLGVQYLSVPMTMEGGDLLIDEAAARYLSFGESYYGFTQSYEGTMVDAEGLPETDDAYGFISTGDYYVSSLTTEIGTIRVSYSYLDFDQLNSRVFTVSGLQNGGCIKAEIFEDRSMTAEELMEVYSDGRTNGCAAAIILGLLLLAFGFLGFRNFWKEK